MRPGAADKREVKRANGFRYVVEVATETAQQPVVLAAQHAVADRARAGTRRR